MRLLGSLGELIEVKCRIALFKESGFSYVSALSDVVRDAGKNDSWKARRFLVFSVATTESLLRGY